MLKKPALPYRSLVRSRAFLIIVPFVILFVTFALSSSIRTWKREVIPQSTEDPEISDGRFDSSETLAWFMNEPISPLGDLLSETLTYRDQVVLGQTAEEKWIDIDLTTQTVRAMEGDREVMKFLVSTGKWGRTPTGEYRIWIKLRYTKMSGGSRAKRTYYYLPNVPYVMYFYKGFGLHGTYWHNNFGQPMSHGCINLSIPDAERLFYWADPPLPAGDWVVKPTKGNPGTRVVIHGVAPS